MIVDQVHEESDEQVRVLVGNYIFGYRPILQEMERLRTYDRLLSKSALTEQDAVALGREVRRGAALRRR